VEVGEQPPQELTTGDIVLIPPMCPQRITNIGKDDLIFLAICSPRYRPDAYEDIEEFEFFRPFNYQTNKKYPIESK